jgi:NAD(P)-dependent dehydrogenase (short-subunit alcohol dehydrogenase family)
MCLAAHPTRLHRELVSSTQALPALVPRRDLDPRHGRDPRRGPHPQRAAKTTHGSRARFVLGQGIPGRSLPVQLIEPGDVSETVLLPAANDSGRYYTGSTLMVDAGMNIA